ncbi:MAG: bile acid:sodium symporter family protein [Pseudomonadota bacterium]
MVLKLFPIWAPLAALLGYLNADLLAQGGGAIVPLLMVIMLCMGLTLTARNFLDVGKYRAAIVVAIILQFTIMPISALIISRLFNLSEQLTLGMILVGTVAGGTSSNIMTYIANGKVALSVTMTAISTLISVVLTPFLVSLLASSEVRVPSGEMLIGLLQIVLLPVGIGLLLNTFFATYVAKVQGAMVMLAVLSILAIIAIVVALNAGDLASVGTEVVLATLMHNCTGLALGYLAAQLLRFEPSVRRTVALEVGLQNSGLATALALKYFTPAAALPGAIFSVWLNIVGALFASICRLEDAIKERREMLNQRGDQ